jgi:hypothetical protein
MSLRSYNDSRQFRNVLSGQDCTLRERAKATECTHKCHCGDLEALLSGDCTSLRRLFAPSAIVKRDLECYGDVSTVAGLFQWI